MSRIYRITGLSVVVAAILVLAFSSTVYASNAVSIGPAPNAGDCVSDGSGFWDEDYFPPEPFGNVKAGSGSTGPAPNAGDCIQDGSGF